MGFVFRKRITRTIPEGAEMVAKGRKTIATWRDGHGHMRRADVRGGRITEESSTWFARYRGADGITVTRPTGCRDRGAAQAVLHELTTRAEKVRAGIMSGAENAAADFAALPVAKHIEDYIANMRARGITSNTVNATKYYLETVAAACHFTRLAELNRSAAERWLLAQDKMGAKTHNAHCIALCAFGNWLVREGRVIVNPFSRMTRRNVALDPKRQRRALSEDEITRLLDAAARRPLAEALTITKGKNKGELLAELSDATRARLLDVGRERVLIYRTLVSTGLRYGELRSIKVGQVDLNGNPATITLRAADEKSRRGAQIPLRADLAEELREHITRRRAASVAPFCAPDSVPLFVMPDKMLRIFDADCAFAGIPKRDSQNRTVDLHALRHSFASALARANVPLVVAQKLMRHTDPAMTSRVYTHLTTLDLAGAVNQLPTFSVALPVALASGGQGQNVASSGNSGGSGDTRQIRVSTNNDGDCQRVAEKRLAYPEGLEPPTPWSEAKCSIRLSYGYI